MTILEQIDALPAAAEFEKDLEAKRQDELLTLSVLVARSFCSGRMDTALLARIAELQEHEMMGVYALAARLALGEEDHAS